MVIIETDDTGTQPSLTDGCNLSKPKTESENLVPVSQVEYCNDIINCFACASGKSNTYIQTTLYYGLLNCNCFDN